MKKSDYNVENLLALAAGLDSVAKENFDMAFFFHNRNDPDQDESYLTIPMHDTCGTAACALGWAPSFCGPKKVGDDCLDYGTEKFLTYPRAFAYMSPEWDALWDACFSSRWSLIDNSPSAAAARIRAFVAALED